jgi:hypothetical protein
MHRAADRWQRTGSELFSETELQVRKRIWYSCVIMDKYVSTYIGELQFLLSYVTTLCIRHAPPLHTRAMAEHNVLGRPLSIFERDFDTPLPGEDPVSISAGMVI